MGGFEYEGVPWPEGAADPQPELRAELEAAGFILIGGVLAAASGDAEIAAMARSYTDDQADAFVHWAHQPGQVFVAPDRRAFAHLSWFWGCRYAAITTVLGDGRMLETMTDWESDPPWPRKLSSAYERTTDRHTEQLVLSMDCDAEVAAGGAERAWSMHQRRLSPFTTEIPDHTRLDDFVRMYRSTSSARSRWARRVRVAASIPALLLAVATVQLLFLLTTPSSWWFAGLIAVAGLAVYVMSYQRMWLLTRRWRRLRPRFRAPVPGTGREIERPAS